MTFHDFGCGNERYLICCKGTLRGIRRAGNKNRGTMSLDAL
jgi:hypothetical protein